MSDIQRSVQIQNQQMNEMQHFSIPRDGTGFEMHDEYGSKRGEQRTDLTLNANKGIMTKGCFSLMELPAELRLKVCKRE